ncbi:response regulator [Aquimarina sp. AD1]|uniref:response regulator n=1 Tax=Aquimarina sp. (strain AD1) TaxID=1714848 RepID=UPI000E4C6A98|nr:response regulator [Aquimarina sp. AD1]AXT57075.1 response regulator [Aquimarina sp. AD1]RKN35077.1 response regulator [Aquimarina sp. AD1]
MPQNTKSVCIIDDDNMYINLVSKIIKLKKLSENVIVFKNGKEALDFFITSINDDMNNRIPQVIFLDLNMPIMDGWEFLQEFDKIKDKIEESIDLYVVSSSIDSRDINKAKSIDLVSDYLTKPIKLGDFEKILV